jgi:hypothetical protein
MFRLASSAKQAQARMEENQNRLETLLQDAEDFKLIAKLLAVVRMTEQMREMTIGLKKLIATPRDCRSTRA